VTSTGPFITAMDDDANYLFTRDDIRSFVHALAIDSKGKIHVARLDSAHIGVDPSVPPDEQNDLNLFHQGPPGRRYNHQLETSSAISSNGAMRASVSSPHTPISTQCPDSRR
jgi:hypothetical protein